ncbi:hypothetical protein [Amycolatopsis arida]|uniref:hypothetical protein n=1 Tax=Amycolatopsis arida TaxID=587909 RepID=UPI000B835491|nr:hypothetical protein [Amycolatopsis arida]
MTDVAAVVVPGDTERDLRAGGNAGAGMWSACSPAAMASPSSAGCRTPTCCPGWPKLPPLLGLPAQAGVASGDSASSTE